MKKAVVTILVYFLVKKKPSFFLGYVTGNGIESEGR